MAYCSGSRTRCSVARIAIDSRSTGRRSRKTRRMPVRSLTTRRCSAARSRTPPHQVGVTELPPAAIEPLVASLRETYLNLPGVAGPEPTATAFAEAWTARFGGKWWLEQRQRLHSLTRVAFPSAPASGALRPALPPDAPVARAWMAGFIRDTRARHVGADAAERLIEQRRLHIWVDGEPRCMVSAGTRHAEHRRDRRRLYATTVSQPRLCEHGSGHVEPAVARRGASQLLLVHRHRESGL